MGDPAPSLPGNVNGHSEAQLFDDSSDSDGDFVEMLFQEIMEEDSFDVPSVDLIIEYAKEGDYELIARAIGGIVDMGQPQWAAEICRRIFGSGRRGQPDHESVSKILLAMSDTGKTQWTTSVCKVLLLPSIKSPSEKQAEVFDCYHLSFILGYMVALGRGEIGAQVLSAILEDPPGETRRPHVALILGMLIDNDCLAWAADLTQHLLYSSSAGPDYETMARVLIDIADQGKLTWSTALCKALLLPGPAGAYEEAGEGYDSTNVSFVLGCIVNTGRLDAAGKVLFAIWKDVPGEAGCPLVANILGDLIDHDRLPWSFELTKQLMYSEDPSQEVDYAIVGWCLAHMVWLQRPDWAAVLAMQLEEHEATWCNLKSLYYSVDSCGDKTYSKEIMRARSKMEAGH